MFTRYKSRLKNIDPKEIRKSNPFLFIPRHRMTTVIDSLEANVLQGSFNKIVRMLRRGIRIGAIAERFKIRRHNLKRFVRELCREVKHSGKD